MSSKNISFSDQDRISKILTPNPSSYMQNHTKFHLSKPVTIIFPKTPFSSKIFVHTGHWTNKARAATLTRCLGTCTTVIYQYVIYSHVTLIIIGQAISIYMTLDNNLQNLLLVGSQSQINIGSQPLVTLVTYNTSLFTCLCNRFIGRWNFSSWLYTYICVNVEPRPNMTGVHSEVLHNNYHYNQHCFQELIWIITSCLLLNYRLLWCFCFTSDYYLYLMRSSHVVNMVWLVAGRRNSMLDYCYGVVYHPTTTKSRQKLPVFEIIVGHCLRQHLLNHFCI